MKQIDGFEIRIAPDRITAGSSATQESLASFWEISAWLAWKRQLNQSANITIKIDSGIHRLDQPLKLDQRHRGEDGSKIMIVGAGRDAAMLTGNETVEVQPVASLPNRQIDRLVASLDVSTGLGWIDVPDRAGVPHDLGQVGFRLPIPHAPPMCLIDRRQLEWTKWPKTAGLNGSVIDVGPVSAADGQSDIRVAFAQPLDGLIESDWLWIELQIKEPWCWYQAPVVQFDRKNAQALLRLPSGISNVGDNISRARFLNAFAGLHEGERALLLPDRRILINSSGLALPGTGEMTGDHPEPLIELSANPAPLLHLQELDGVDISGLTLSGGLASGIVIDRCNDIQVRSCFIENFGFAGIEIVGTNISVSDVSIQNTGRAGIHVRSGDDALLETGSSRVEKCSLRSWARWVRVYEPAIRIFGVGTLISSCHFSDGPHMAIEVTGNDHAILHNTFTDVAKSFEDMGAIYLNQGEFPLRRGITIAGNLFFDIGDSGTLNHAVYVDWASYGVTVSENVFLNVGQTGKGCAAIYANGSSDLTVRQNLFVLCPLVLDFNFYLAAWGELIDLEIMRQGRLQAITDLSNLNLPHNARYPELGNFETASLIFPASNTFTDNVIVDDDIRDRHWHINFGPEKLMQIAGNAIVSHPEAISGSESKIARLLAGRDRPRLAEFILNAADQWHAVATRADLGVDPA